MNIALYSITPLRYFKEATTLTTIALAKELQNQGHNVVIITEKAKGLPRYQEISNGPKGNVPIHRLYKIPYLGKIISYPLSLRRIQKKFDLKFDIVHSFSATPLFVLSSFVSKMITPGIKTIHTLKSYSRRKDKYSFLLLNLADRVTVPTKVFAKKLRFVKKKKIHIIFSPINLKKFRPSDKEKLKEKHGYKNEKIVFYYGSFHEHKGVSNLIKSIPLVVNSSRNVRFVFAPRYKDIPKERNLVKQLGIEKYTEFITHDIPIEEYVNLADTVVLPYNNLIATEGNPSCMLEAMACKTPVVTTALPEIKEIAEGDVLMAKPKDVNSIAENIIIILSNKNNSNHLMVEKAFAKAQEFDAKKIAAHFSKLYKELKTDNKNMQ